MLTKNKLRSLQQLQTKKGREESGLFIAEGLKIVEELLRSDIEVTEVFKVLSSGFEVRSSKGAEIIEVSEEELKKISSLVTPNEVLVVAEIPQNKLDVAGLKDELTLVLDDIQDPGNMGTIIRVADWFGIKNIVCSLNSVDCYSPKVVQATMGSIARVKIHYIELMDFFKPLTHNKIYGAVLGGDNIYSKKLSDKGFIVIGNESKGISDKILSLVTDKIAIPNYSHLKQSGGEAESLNAAIAAAIICAEFRRVQR
jgi:TrmH family RNA methyltransferase